MVGETGLLINTAGEIGAVVYVTALGLFSHWFLGILYLPDDRMVFSELLFHLRSVQS